MEEKKICSDCIYAVKTTTGEVAHCELNRKPDGNVCVCHCNGVNKKYIKGKYKDDIKWAYHHRCIVCGTIFFVPDMTTWAYCHDINSPTSTGRSARTKMFCSYTCMKRYRDVVDPEANCDAIKINYDKYIPGGTVFEEEDK